MGLFKQAYLRKANDLFERLLDEQPEAPPEAPEKEKTDEEGGDETPATDEKSEEDTTDEETPAEQAEPKKLEIFYTNLDKDTKKSFLEAILESLNAEKDDDIATRKIEEVFSKKPLVTLIADEIVRKLNIKI